MLKSIVTRAGGSYDAKASREDLCKNIRRLNATKKVTKKVTKKKKGASSSSCSSLSPKDKAAVEKFIGKMALNKRNGKQALCRAVQRYASPQRPVAASSPPRKAKITDKAGIKKALLKETVKYCVANIGVSAMKQFVTDNGGKLKYKDVKRTMENLCIAEKRRLKNAKNVAKTPSSSVASSTSDTSIGTITGTITGTTTETTTSGDDDDLSSIDSDDSIELVDRDSSLDSNDILATEQTAT